MVSIEVLGVSCGLIAAVFVIAIAVFCKCVVYRKRDKKALSPLLEARGDYKPVAFIQDVVKPDQEELSIQPRQIPASKRNSFRESTDNEDAISLSTRSEASTNSSGFEVQLGSIKPDLYQRKDAVLRHKSQESDLGRLHLRLKYDFNTSDLVVHLIEAQSLPPMDVIGGFSDPFVRICLEPEVDGKIRQSSVQRKTLNPVFNEYFKFPITFDDLRERVLHCYVYDFDKFSRNDLIGDVRVNFADVDISPTVEIWSDIQKHTKSASNSGELLISLSYLLTAERLTLLVMKAKNLRTCSITGRIDPFVKVSLVVDDKKIKKKKTEIRKNTPNPVWNEALIFNVPAEILPKVSLDIVVMDHDLIGHNEVIGHCVIGRNRQGEEGAHMTEVIQNPRKAIAKWHQLHA